MPTNKWNITVITKIEMDKFQFVIETPIVSW